jgi:hypothetical protein
MPDQYNESGGDHGFLGEFTVTFRLLFPIQAGIAGHHA